MHFFAMHYNLGCGHCNTSWRGGGRLHFFFANLSIFASLQLCIFATLSAKFPVPRKVLFHYNPSEDKLKLPMC